MKPVLDVVNFNADGSCLPSERWLAALAGGRNSELCRWLSLYVEEGKRVSLGLVGATVADVAARNPEALDVIRSHPRVFEILLRPFSHDIPLLRTSEGFRRNVELGREVLQRELGNVLPWFLPPEFMLTGTQIRILRSLGIEGVFINASRWKAEVAVRIPSEPYIVRGVLASKLPCIPLDGALTRAYLAAIHGWGDDWSAAVGATTTREARSWRDGEGFLFLPEGIERERTWLRSEAPDLRRTTVAEIAEARPIPEAEPPHLSGYPVHPFSEWVRELRMLGFIRRVDAVEARLGELSPEERVLWLQAINSDVLSAVEKDDPRILIRDAPGAPEREAVLLRSPRGFEGEDFLALLEEWPTSPQARRHFAEGPGAHLEKVRARHAALRGAA